MAEVAFYHLSRPFEATLPRLLERILDQGNRVAIRADPARADEIDRLLWIYDDASFLPHGRDGDENAADQPVLITGGDAPANGATVMMVLDPPIPTFDGRLLYFFDAAALESSRAAWRSLDGREGLERSYWQQDERGKWAKKA